MGAATRIPQLNPLLIPCISCPLWLRIFTTEYTERTEF